MTDAVQEWMRAYRRAWESNVPGDIRALFALDALYYTEPFNPPARGVEAIVATWLDKKDEPGDTTFTWSPVTMTESLAVVKGETVYRNGPTYSNLWVIRFDEEGRAAEFTEWWMEQGTPTPS